MTDWPRWSLRGEELALARYVLPDSVRSLVELPGPSAESQLTRLRSVYQALANVGIGYAYAEATDEAGRQVIRPPDQVLWAPRHATCLDLALILAAGCLVAGLHPAVVILQPEDPTAALHALLLVRTDRGTRPGSGTAVWPAAPDGLLDELQGELDGPPRAWLPIDPVGLAVSLGSAATVGLSVDLSQAVRNGAGYLAGVGERAGGWAWQLGVDLGTTWRRQDTLLLELHPPVEPLREPYRDAETAESALRLLRAEYKLVPFQARDELVVLRDFCAQVTKGSATRLAVVTGLGGSGKTRLALELADKLRGQGWYAGVLPKGHNGVDWLATVVSRLLVIVDYADGRPDDVTALLKALRARRGPAAVVVLTARSADGDWLTTVTDAATDDRHPLRVQPIALPDTPPALG